jgi:hypothetical protein
MYYQEFEHMMTAKLGVMDTTKGLQKHYVLPAKIKM